MIEQRFESVMRLLKATRTLQERQLVTSQVGAELLGQAFALRRSLLSSGIGWWPTLVDDTIFLERGRLLFLLPVEIQEHNDDRDTDDEVDRHALTVP